MAGSTMRTFVESMSAVAVVSFSRVTKVSYSARVLSTSRWNSRNWNSLRAMSWICALLLLKDWRSEASLAEASWYCRSMPATTCCT
ncbi:hypothetical protein D3C76_1055900 [compost metagenome]